ncbi:MAG: DnaJ domain-containing protein, partial [Gammaproteobacteria bacterium]|nr:DnaJ domain-containing protein [Gammaproteobacteria bacterium]
VCRQLGVPEIIFRRMVERARAERHYAGAPPGEAARAISLEDAYAILGVRPGDPPDAIRKAYRRLLSQHHPDKLVSKGLPDEMMRLASQKTHEIRQAYERIRAAHGF